MPLLAELILGIGAAARSGMAPVGHDARDVLRGGWVGGVTLPLGGGTSRGDRRHVACALRFRLIAIHRRHCRFCDRVVVYEQNALGCRRQGEIATVFAVARHVGSVEGGRLEFGKSLGLGKRPGPRGRDLRPGKFCQRVS